MAGIFVSYRRDDTRFWADRLFENLARRFGIRQVFMDINGGIRRGADFPAVLDRSVNQCDILLALIGPNWLTICGADNKRRLDSPQDWVRKEISRALERGIHVFPVLFDSVQLPDRDNNDLPELLRPLLDRNAARIRVSDWYADVDALVRDIAAATGLPAAGDDVFAAMQGLGLLRDLVARTPEVRAAVVDCKTVLQSVQEQTERLRVSKDMHDALHVVEFDCLRQLNPDRTAGLRACRRRFDLQKKAIEKSLDSPTVPAPLRDDIREYLEDAAAALQNADENPAVESVLGAIGALNVLISAVPPRLNERISDAVNGLELARVAELMRLVSERLPQEDANLPEIDGLFKGTQALARVGEDLRKKKVEHGQLQRLDTRLRTVCVGAASLTTNWPRIKNLFNELVPPCSEPVEAYRGDLLLMQGEIDEAIAQAKSAHALDLLNEYFRAIGEVFRAVDSDLKQWCLELGGVSKPVKSLLEML